MSLYAPINIYPVVFIDILDFTFNTSFPSVSYLVFLMTFFESVCMFNKRILLGHNMMVSLGIICFFHYGGRKELTWKS
jgi:hypothetical protein